MFEAILDLQRKIKSTEEMMKGLMKERTNFKDRSDYHSNISDLADFIYDYKRDIYNIKIDIIVDFYKDKKDLTFIKTSNIYTPHDRYIVISGVCYGFDSITISKVTKSRKTMHLKIHNGDTIKEVVISTRRNNLKETTQTLLNFLVAYNKKNQ